MATTLTVELAYGLPHQQWLLALELPEGTTLQGALDYAREQQLLPVLLDNPTLDGLQVGIWNQVEREPALRVLQTGDRIEIYRALTLDPKEARKARALKAQQRGS